MKRILLIQWFRNSKPVLKNWWGMYNIAGLFINPLQNLNYRHSCWRCRVLLYERRRLPGSFGCGKRLLNLNRRPCGTGGFSYENTVTESELLYGGWWADAVDTANNGILISLESNRRLFTVWKFLFEKFINKLNQL